MARTDISRPVKLALSDGLLDCQTPFLDYGCGQGDDVRRLNDIGVPAYGWDPVHAPERQPQKASVVNLGYVVNVIEDPVERNQTLRDAWSLTEAVLIVSARLTTELRAANATTRFSDGCLTSLGTFQKYYEQHELKIWIHESLNTPAVPAAPGVFYVFRHEDARLTFQSSRLRRSFRAPRRSRSTELFDQNEEVLTRLITFVTERGRIPHDDELENAQLLKEIFGSIKRAFRVIQLATSKDQWESIREERAQELLIYLALCQFEGRPKYSQLPRPLQHDVRSFYARYTHACRKADQLLFSLRDCGQIDAACSTSPIGKLLPPALYIHESALNQLSAILRLYEGCARTLVGNITGGTIIKLCRKAPRISYLCYPDFEVDPHPALSLSITVNLQTLRVKYKNFQHYQNPPILHRKETFLAPAHPLHKKFSRLTRIEDSKGLYQDTTRIGTRDGWNRVLAEKGYRLQGHRLLRRLR